MLIPRREQSCPWCKEIDTAWDRLLGWHDLIEKIPNPWLMRMIRIERVFDFPARTWHYRRHVEPERRCST